MYETTAKDSSRDEEETLNVVIESNANTNKDNNVKNYKQSVDRKDDLVLASKDNSKDESNKSSNANTTAIPFMASETVPISNVKLTKSPQDGASIVAVVKSESQPFQNKSTPISPLQLPTTNRLENLLPNSSQLPNNVVEIKSNNTVANKSATIATFISSSPAVQADKLVSKKSSPNSMAIVGSEVASVTDTLVEKDSEIVDKCDKKEALLTPSNNTEKEDVKN